LRGPCRRPTPYGNTMLFSVSQRPTTTSTGCSKDPRRSRMRQMSQPVHSITDAPVRHSVEQRSRMVRYTIAMSIRLVCFVAAAVVAVVWETWWALVPALAATVLPYIAVVNANAGGDRYAAQRADEAPQRQLGTGHEE